MKRLLSWLALGASIFTLVLLANFPAATALKLVTMPKMVSLTGVSGTVWNGRAESLTLKQFTAYEVEWQLAFLPLLTGTAELTVSAGQNPSSQIQLDGLLQIQDPRQWQATDVRFSLPAQLINAFKPLPFKTKLQGQLRGFVATAVSDQPWCQQLDADLVWQEAAISSTYLKPALQLKNVEAKLGCDKGELTARVKDPQRVFGMDLALRLDKQRHLFADGSIKPAEKLPKSVAQGMIFFAQPESDGSYTVRFDTQL